MSRQHQYPRGGGDPAPALWLAAPLLGLLLAAAPARAQTASRFSPRLKDDEAGAPAGPALAFYTGIARGFDDHMGTAFGVQLEVGRAGPARAALGFLAGKGIGALEGGVLIQPEREAGTTPYVAITAFARDVFEGESGGVALHVGADLRHTRELAFRIEGRAYLANQAALAALIGVAFR